MPNRYQAAAVLANESLGLKHFNFHGEGNGPIPWAMWDEAEAAGDAVYCRVVDTIDWSRALLEASVLHMKRPEHEATYPHEHICGSCLRDSLLAMERAFNWDDTGNVDIPKPKVDDWAAGVASAVDNRHLSS